MEVEDAYNYLTNATSLSKLESFMIFGGEPMLYPQRAIAIIKKAHQLRIPKIEVITNGVWGKNKEAAEKLATKLKNAGLNSIHLSVDAFHLQYVPLEYPRNAALASLKAGIRNISWNVAIIESLDAINEYDIKTAQILQSLQPMGLGVCTVKILSVGRAPQNLRQHLERTSPCGPCECEPLEGNTMTDPKSICIEPSGSANICWKLPIGNAKNIPLRRLVAEYEWQRNPIIRILVQEGPTGLLKLPEACAFQFQEKEYINKCHLCVEVRRTLKPYYPNAYS